MSYIQTSVFLPSSLTNLSLPYLLSFFWLSVITHLPWLCGAAVSEALFHLPSTFLVPSPLENPDLDFLGLPQPGSLAMMNPGLLFAFLLSSTLAPSRQLDLLASSTC